MEVHMKRTALFTIGFLAFSSILLAQGRGAPAPPPALEPGASQADVDIALAAAPANQKNQATVIKWKKDFTYDTLRKGTSTLVCYDQSGWANEQPYSVQCTSLANLERVAQNKKFEAIADNAARQAAIAAAEKDGTRVKPEFGSLFITLSGKDKETARTHMTIAVPGATMQSLGLPENNKQGGVWIMNPGTSTAHLMIPGS
jgi:hypothetical protein